jgi:hypothetical protein
MLLLQLPIGCNYPNESEFLEKKSPIRVWELSYKGASDTLSEGLDILHGKNGAP